MCVQVSKEVHKSVRVHLKRSWREVGVHTALWFHFKLKMSSATVYYNFITRFCVWEYHEWGGGSVRQCSVRQFINGQCTTTKSPPQLHIDGSFVAGPEVGNRVGVPWNWKSRTASCHYLLWSRLRQRHLQPFRGPRRRNCQRTCNLILTLAMSLIVVFIIIIFIIIINLLLLSIYLTSKYCIQGGPKKQAHVE